VFLSLPGELALRRYFENCGPIFKGLNPTTPTATSSLSNIWLFGPIRFWDFLLNAGLKNYV
jgi:hypothetical protein